MCSYLPRLQSWTETGAGRVEAAFSEEIKQSRREEAEQQDKSLQYSTSVPFEVKRWSVSLTAGSFVKCLLMIQLDEHEKFIKL